MLHSQLEFENIDGNEDITTVKRDGVRLMKSKTIMMKLTMFLVMFIMMIIGMQNESYVANVVQYGTTTCQACRADASVYHTYSSGGTHSRMYICNSCGANTSMEPIRHWGYRYESNGETYHK